MTTVIVLPTATTEQQRSEVVVRLESVGVECRVHSPTLISVPLPVDPAGWAAARLPAGTEVAELAGDYPRAAKPAHPRPSTVRVGSHLVGGGTGFFVIAGPCVVETRDQLLTTARAVRTAGAHALRGGLFKPRTSPYAFQGHGADGVKLALEARQETGLPFVTEVLDLRDIDLLVGTADMLQIGARNMQNYPLLRELGRTRKPLLLKRAVGATIDETLMAAEYLLDGGNDQVVICERGIRTFERSYRFTLDLAAVTVLRERTHLPVVVDPSHAGGLRERVGPLALAAAACGADGILVEVHCSPASALCDGAQALSSADLSELMHRLRLATRAAGRQLVPSPPRVADPAS